MARFLNVFMQILSNDLFWNRNCSNQEDICFLSFRNQNQRMEVHKSRFLFSLLSTGLSVLRMILNAVRDCGSKCIECKNNI